MGLGANYLFKTAVIFGSADPVPGADHHSHPGLVNSTPITSRIAGIVIKGRAFGTDESGDHFGIVADQIVRLKVGPAIIPLHPGANNDNYFPPLLTSDGIPLSPTWDFTVRETDYLYL
jgi:hypothetical protein